MCGIVGYIGPREPEGVLLEGLKRLEYRGYDSAGVAIFNKGKVKIVHNGIIENYIELKDDLISKVHKFLSETDTEVIVHLIDEELKRGDNRGEAIRRAMLRLKWAYALGVIFDDDEKHLYAIRNGAPLIVG